MSRPARPDPRTTPSGQPEGAAAHAPWTRGVRPADLRLPALAAAAYAGTVLGWVLSPAWVVSLVAGTFLVAGACARHRWWGAVAAALVLSGLAGTTALRVEAVAASPVAAWAPDRPVVSVVLHTTTDPRPVRSPGPERVTIRATVTSWTVRGREGDVSAPVLVIAPASWAEVPWGSTLAATARLGESDRGDTAAVLAVIGEPQLLGEPTLVLRAADRVRHAVRAAAAGAPGDADALVPALVTGDDADLPDHVVDDFRTAGLTHLTAVSGTNLTIVLACVLLVARAARVRGRGLLGCGLLTVVAFVLVAHPEPSVLRAAVMGGVALVGLRAGGGAAGRAAGQSAGGRALGAAVVLLLCLSPRLATQPGFALSVLATGGILFLAPALRDALATWLPRPVAEAVAVPFAAQLACTPVVAALSGELSLVAVAANLVVAPLVAPATVLGLAGGLLGLLWAPLGLLVAAPAGWCAWSVLAVGSAAAGVPGAAVGWSVTVPSLVALAVLCLLAVPVSLAVARRRWAATTLVVLLLVALLRPLPGVTDRLAGRLTGWPPPGWLLVACDVGQGDALVVRTAPGSALVVDAGPDPARVDACLSRLGVSNVPALVLTHFHADHVDGTAGVLRGRAVGEVQVTALPEPASGADQVAAVAATAGVPVRVVRAGEEAQSGAVRWQVVGPERVVSSEPNEASLVLLVTTSAVRILLAGDAETGEQAQLAGAGLGAVDVLKVAHHGSRSQDHALLASLAPRVAVVSVGADNDYGHPDATLLARLADAGASVARTDQLGDVAVVLEQGTLAVRGR